MSSRISADCSYRDSTDFRQNQFDTWLGVESSGGMRRRRAHRVSFAVSWTVSAQGFGLGGA